MFFGLLISSRNASPHRTGDLGEKCGLFISFSRSAERRRFCSILAELARFRRKKAFEKFAKILTKFTHSAETIFFALWCKKTLYSAERKFCRTFPKLRQKIRKWTTWPNRANPEKTSEKRPYLASRSYTRRAKSPCDLPLFWFVFFCVFLFCLALIIFSLVCPLLVIDVVLCLLLCFIVFFPSSASWKFEGTGGRETKKMPGR